MDPIRSISIRSKMTFALRLIDAFTGKPPADRNMNVSMKGLAAKAMMKEGGYAVFVDLSAGQYRIVVTSDWYAPIEVEVSVSPENAGAQIMSLQLVPQGAYPFPPHTTLVRATLFNEDGQVPQMGEAKAVLLSDECACARLTSDEVHSGTLDLQIVPLYGSILPGDKLLIRDKEGNDEEVEADQAADRKLVLTKPLRFNHGWGAALVPISYATCSERGDIALAIRPCRMNIFQANVTFTNGVHSVIREVSLKEGQTLSLGRLALPI